MIVKHPLHLSLLLSSCISLIGMSAVLRDVAAQDNSIDFPSEVLPILRTHCVHCHGPETQESDLRLDRLSTDLVNDRASAENWHDVLNVLHAGEMPPDGEPRLSGPQRATLTRWIESAIAAAVETQRDTGGRMVLRRLNRVEYQNTMTDLLGMEMDYDRDLPPDAISSDGFLNDAHSLQMSALQLEYYLDTARRALDRAITSGPAPRVYNYRFTESNVTQWLRDTQRSNRLGRQQQFLATMIDDYPEQGAFRVRVTLSAELKAHAGYPLLEVSVGYRPDTKILFREFELVEVTSTEEQVFEFQGRIENFPLPVRGQGKFPGLVVRVRNVYDDGSPLPDSAGERNAPTFPDEPHLPKLIVKSVEFQGPYFDQWPPSSHRQILFDSPIREANEAEYIAEVLRSFMSRAYRRPAEQAEVATMLDFFASIRGEFPTFESAIRETLAMVLIRPEFLYLVEPAGDQRRAISDWELASRLSYFLWSSMPDQRLLDLAAQGELGRAETLSDEANRMLDDPRAWQFVKHFTDQWLRLNVIDSVAISDEYYPDFNNGLKQEMRGETEHFFAELLRHDLSALNLLSSDFTMLNEPLARHYGIRDIRGIQFRRVSLEPDRHRGGLLGHAGVLLSNSTGTDSHAVRRAVWIRDRLLDDPPASPPPDVPTLDEADPTFLKLSIREQLEIHRGTEACASCHRNIDPWGIALENFDAVGLWRDTVRTKVGGRFELLPVNAKDSLPGRVEFDGVESLKDYLVTEKQRQFARSLTSRLMTYAVGRRLEWSDREAVDELAVQFESDDYRLRSLIHKVVTSTPFQSK